MKLPKKTLQETSNQLRKHMINNYKVGTETTDTIYMI